jgi:hypothetical protein
VRETGLPQVGAKGNEGAAVPFPPEVLAGAWGFGLPFVQGHENEHSSAASIALPKKRNRSNLIARRM